MTVANNGRPERKKDAEGHEVKDVEKESDLHAGEDMKIKCAEVFYEMLRKDGIDVRYQKQLRNQKLADIIAQVMEKADTGVEIRVDVPEKDRFKTYLNQSASLLWLKFPQIIE